MIAVADVKDLMGIRPSDTASDVEIQLAVDAAVAIAADSRPDVDWTTPNGAQRLGLLRLARKFSEPGADDSGSSLETFGGFPASAVDSDIQRLLGIGRYRPAVVA